MNVWPFKGWNRKGCSHRSLWSAAGIALAALLVALPSATAQIGGPSLSWPRPLDLGHVAIRLHEGAEPALMTALRGRLGRNVEMHPHARDDLRVVHLPEPKSARELAELVDELATMPGSSFASLVYRSELDLLEFPTPWILLRFLELMDSSEQRRLIDSVEGVEVVETRFGGMENAYRLFSSAATSREVLDHIAVLRGLPGVLWVESDRATGVLLHDGYTPNDPRFPDLWGLRNTGQGPFGGPADRDVDADDAWCVTFGDPSILVVVLDNGVQQDHPDLHLAPGADFTDQGPGTGGPLCSEDNHGTWVAGPISAIIDNAIGVVGVAPGCRVASARMNRSCGSSGNCNGGDGFYCPSYLINALEWARSIGARVSNSSFGVPFQQSLADKYAETRAAGIVHLAASGNDRLSPVSFPASDPSVLAIVAVRDNGNGLPTNSTGPEVFASAPGGEGIWTTDRTGSSGGGSGDYIELTGQTSLACAYASGVAAILLSHDSTLSPAAVESILAATADDWFGGGWDEITGWGIVNARAALESLGDVFVDGSVASSGNGSILAPFKTVAEGRNAVTTGGTIAIRAGSYAENISISRGMILRAVGGPVRIGQ